MRFAGAASGATLFWAYARTERFEKSEHFRRIRGYIAMPNQPVNARINGSHDEGVSIVP